MGFLADASEGGVNLSAGMPLMLHQSLRMNFQLEDGPSIDAAAEVVWVNDTRHSGGLRFVEIEADSREQIRAWVTALPPAIEDVEEEAPAMEGLGETAGPISQEQRPEAPELPTATWSGMLEVGAAGMSALPRPPATSPFGPTTGAAPDADQTIPQTDASADSLLALRAGVLRLQKEKEQTERNRLRRLVQAGVVGVIAATALVAAIALVRSQQARISAVFTELKKSATDIFASQENDEAQKPSQQPQGGKAGVHKGRRPAGAASRAGEPSVSSSSSESVSDQAVGLAAAPVYRVTYLGKEWNVIPRTGTIVAFQTPTWDVARNGKNVIPKQATAAQTSPGSGPTNGPASNPASSESTSIAQPPLGESDNSILVPIYSPLDLRSRELAEGSVILFVIVREDGTVRDVHLLSKPSELALAIAKAVRLWRYQPVLRDGKPVEVEVRIAIDITPTLESRH